MINTKLITNCFYGLLLVNTVLLLLPLWGGGRIAQLWDVKEFNSLAIRIVRYVNLIFVLVILANTKPKHPNILRSIVLVFVMMVISMIANFDFSQVTTAIEFLLIDIALFCCLDEINPSAILLKYLSLIFILWSIAPIVYFPFASGSEKLAMFATDLNASEVTSTFCGFAVHRNTYSFIAGISILLCLFSNIKSTYKFILIAVACIGLFLSASRGCIVGVAVALLFYYAKETTNKQKIFFVLLLSIGIYLMYKFGVETESRIIQETTTGREDIYAIAWRKILQSPIFGYGKNVLLDIGHFDGELSPVHNFILQTWLDYGIGALLFFLIFLLQLFNYSCRKAKTLLLFLLIVGFVQPYFSLTSPAQYILITYLFIIYYNMENHTLKKMSI